MPAFSDSDWKAVLSHLAQVIGPEAERYADNPAARLFASIAAVAGSEDADRFAVSNLLTFHAATKARALFDHRPDDDGDVLRRLATLHVGNQADPKVVDYGLTLLALISLNDHERDAAADRAAGKYNPLNAGKWDAAAIRKDLTATLDQSPANRDAFAAAVPGATTTLGYWNT